MHLLLMLGCSLKVVASAWIGYFVFRCRMLAIAFGLLVLVFPADTQQMSLRTMHISLAGGLMLAGIANCVYGLMAHNIRQRMRLIALSMVLCAIGGLIYEAYLPFYVFPVCLFWARYGLPTVLRVLVFDRANSAHGDCAIVSGWATHLEVR